MAQTAPAPEVVERLAAFFHRNGYVRRLEATRRVREGQLYKKGAELRLVAQSRVALAEIRRLLQRAGFKLARPFAKGRQWRQPVYGVAEVARFLGLVGKRKSAEAGAARDGDRAGPADGHATRPSLTTANDKRSVLATLSSTRPSQPG